MYWFDKCPLDNLDEIGDLCKSMGLRECRCETPVRQWLGEKGEICLVKYDPYIGIPPLPLLVQTWPPYNHKNPKVKGLLKKLVDITGTEQIYRDHIRTKKIDMLALG